MTARDFLKRLSRAWFWLFLAGVVVLYFYQRRLATYLLLLAIAGYAVSLLPVFRQGRRGKYLKFFRRHTLIDGATAATRLGKPLYRVEAQLHRWARDPRFRDLVVFVKNNYVFVHSRVLAEFCDLWEQGYGERELLGAMRKYGLDTRELVKAVSQKLGEFDRLPERKVSVQERRERLRYQV